MKINTLFFALLFTAIITLPTNAMEQQANPISSQRAMQIVGGFCIQGSGKICIQGSGKMVIQGISIPTGTYTAQAIQDFVKKQQQQELLNRKLSLALTQKKPIYEIATLIAAGASLKNIYNYIPTYNMIKYQTNDESFSHKTNIQRLLQAGAINKKAQSISIFS